MSAPLLIPGGGFGGAGVSDYLTKTSAYTAVDKDKILGDTSGGAFTITLPASPSSGQFIVIADAKNTWATNNLTVGRNGSNIEGSAADLIGDVSGVQIMLVFAGGSVGWRVLYQMATASSLSIGLPKWTYQAGGGTPTAGHFTADNDNPSLSTTLKFYNVPKVAGPALDSYFSEFSGLNVYFTLVDSTGKTYLFEFSTPSLTSNVWTLTSNPSVVDSGPFSGDYILCIAPTQFVASVNGNGPNNGNVAVSQVSVNTASGQTGFTGSGGFTNFSIQDGIITSAS